MSNTKHLKLHLIKIKLYETYEKFIRCTNMAHIYPDNERKIKMLLRLIKLKN